MQTTSRGRVNERRTPSHARVGENKAHNAVKPARGGGGAGCAEKRESIKKGRDSTTRGKGKRKVTPVGALPPRISSSKNNKGAKKKNGYFLNPGKEGIQAGLGRIQRSRYRRERQA